MAQYRMKCRKLELVAFVSGLPSLWDEENEEINFEASSDERALTQGNRLAFLQLRKTGMIEVRSIIEVSLGRELLANTMEPSDKGFVIVKEPVPEANISRKK